MFNVGCRTPSMRSCLAFSFAVLITSIGTAEQPKPQLIETNRIWNTAPHNAFTDLVRWNDKFYCAFREGDGHAGDIGKLRVIVSTDGDKWEPAGLLSMDKYDLRDAALSVTPDGRASSATTSGSYHARVWNHRNYRQSHHPRCGRDVP